MSLLRNKGAPGSRPHAQELRRTVEENQSGKRRSRIRSPHRRYRERVMGTGSPVLQERLALPHLPSPYKGGGNKPPFFPGSLVSPSFCQQMREHCSPDLREGRKTRTIEKGVIGWKMLFDS